MAMHQSSSFSIHPEMMQDSMSAMWSKKDLNCWNATVMEHNSQCMQKQMVSPFKMIPLSICVNKDKQNNLSVASVNRFG